MKVQDKFCQLFVCQSNYL